MNERDRLLIDMVSEYLRFRSYRIRSVEASVDVGLYCVERNLFVADGAVGGALRLGLAVARRGSG